MGVFRLQIETAETGRVGGVSEIDLVRALQLKASELGHRLWRNVTAMAWAGQSTKIHQTMMIRVYPGDVVVRKAYPIHAGLAVGSPDLVGISSTGRFLGIEVKSTHGRATTAQDSFVDMVNRLGGIGIIAKSIDDFHV